jgi:uncharacterized protein (TIGR00251 family)
MIINVKVRPQSGKQEVKKISEKEYVVSLKNPAVENKANLELIKLLGKYFSCNINIIKGLKSRRKVIKIGKV